MDERNGPSARLDSKTATDRQRFWWHNLERTPALHSYVQNENFEQHPSLDATQAINLGRLGLLGLLPARVRISGCHDGIVGAAPAEIGSQNTLNKQQPCQQASSNRQPHQTSTCQCHRTSSCAAEVAKVQRREVAPLAPFPPLDLMPQRNGRGEDPSYEPWCQKDLEPSPLDPSNCSHVCSTSAASVHPHLAIRIWDKPRSSEVPSSSSTQCLFLCMLWQSGKGVGLCLEPGPTTPKERSKPCYHHVELPGVRNGLLGAARTATKSVQ